MRKNKLVSEREAFTRKKHVRVKTSDGKREGYMKVCRRLCELSRADLETSASKYED